MKKLLFFISFIFALLSAQSQDIKFISVNGAVDTFEHNITVKRLYRRFSPDSTPPDTIKKPYRWMRKLTRKLTREQRKDSNIYIFFCPTFTDSITSFLPISGKYGYISVDTAKTSAYWSKTLEKLRHRSQYQWDLIHHPRLIIPWLQDDEGAAYYNATIEDIWINNLNNITCALKNKQNQLNIKVEADLNSRASRKVDPIFTYHDVSVQVNAEKLPENGLCTIELNNYTIIQGGDKTIYSFNDANDGSLKIEFHISNSDEAKFTGYLQTPGESYFDDLVVEIPNEESNEAYEKLAQLPVCSYEGINLADRLKYLNWLAEEWKNNEDQEEMILDLITYTDDLNGLYTWLQGNPKVLAELMLGCDGDRRAQFINQITKICDANWPTGPTSKGDVYVGMVPSSYGAFYSGNDFLTFAKLKDGSTDCEVLSYIGRFPKGPFDWGNVQNLKTLSQFDCNLLDPVTVYSTEGDIGTMPLIYAVNLSHQAGTSAVGDQFAATLNYIGVASSVSILAKGAGALQKTLALIELSKTGLDMIFNDAEVIAALNQTEDGKQFLKYWQIASVTIDLATIGTDVISGLIEHGAKASKAARAAGKTDAADNIDNLVNEARKIAAQAKIPSSLATKLGDQVSELSDWLVKFADELPEDVTRLLEDLNNRIGTKQILNIKEDGAGKLLVQTAGENRNNVHAIIRRQDNTYVTHDFIAYKPAANPDYDVPLSDNLLAPDYEDTKYIFPKDELKAGQENIVRIEMTGQYKTTAGDFYAANEVAGFVEEFGTKLPSRMVNGRKINYTWHHVDDMVDENGVIWCTMQLVESNAHTKLKGFGHSGASAQYRIYTNNSNAYK